MDTILGRSATLLCCFVVSILLLVASMLHASTIDADRSDGIACSDILLFVRVDARFDYFAHWDAARSAFGRLDTWMYRRSPRLAASGHFCMLIADAMIVRPVRSIRDTWSLE